MQEYSLPPRVSGIVFDIDRTLYTNDAYANSQLESQYRKAADHWKIGVAESRERVRLWREEYAKNNGGVYQSMGNAMAGLGIPMATIIRWREETICPADFLDRDPHLAAVLARLAQRAELIAVTNNPVSVGRATLEVLGVTEYLRDIVGLETTGHSKPSLEPFREAVMRLGVPAGETICVGDRYDVDIGPALAVGMGGVLVDGVEEVYTLPDFLLSRGCLD